MRIAILLSTAILLVSGCGGADKPCGDCTCVPDPVPVAPGCVSNAECTEPTPVCDVARGGCIECLILSDCGHEPGTVCSAGACVCPGGATWCAPDLCVDVSTSTDNCGTCGHACFGSCVAGACADAWEPVATLGAPAARDAHVAVWTGSVMVVWGGSLTGTSTAATNTGGMYDPATYHWTSTSTVNAPSPRMLSSAVWTGTEMLVWGGRSTAGALGDGAAFNPTTNTWRTMSTVNAPPARLFAPPVWTGSKMVVWGGIDDGDQQLASGGAYDPVADTWTALPALPESRSSHTAVWAAELGRMQIYGGYGDSGVDTDVAFPFGTTPGGRAYDPVGNAWTAVSVIGEPASRAFHTAVWTGAAMLVWGGMNPGNVLDTGGSYESLVWTALPPGPEARYLHSAVWLADAGVMIVWGGTGLTGLLPTGSAYSPSTTTWTPLPTALSGRAMHTAVSTGHSMIVWGGTGPSSSVFGDGGVYTP